MSRFHPDDDIVELQKAAADGDESAWEALVVRFSPLIWSICRAYRLREADAQDVYQFAWLTLTQHLGRIKEPACLGGWLATVTKNECLRILGRAARQIPTDTLIEADHPDDTTYADAFILLEERNAEIWRAVDRLGDPCRALLRMLFSPDANPSYEEVSSRLNMPIGSVGPTRMRCLERLRHLLL